jgi:hypothetical protein
MSRLLPEILQLQMLSIIVKLVGAQSTIVVAGLRGEGGRRSGKLSNGYTVSVMLDK